MHTRLDWIHSADSPVYRSLLSIWYERNMDSHSRCPNVFRSGTNVLCFDRLIYVTYLQRALQRTSQRTSPTILRRPGIQKKETWSSKDVCSGWCPNYGNWNWGFHPGNHILFRGWAESSRSIVGVGSSVGWINCNRYRRYLVVISGRMSQEGNSGLGYFYLILN